MGTVDGGPLSTHRDTLQPCAAVAWQTGEEGLSFQCGVLGACLTSPPSFAPTQLPLAWTEARVQMEVGAPSSPPGRLPACECLARRHQWAGPAWEGICPLPLPPSLLGDAAITSSMCVAWVTSCVSLLGIRQS